MGSRAFPFFGQLPRGQQSITCTAGRAASPSTLLLLLLNIDLLICAPRSPSHCPGAFHVAYEWQDAHSQEVTGERAAAAEQNCGMLQLQNLKPTIPHPCCMSQHRHPYT